MSQQLQVLEDPDEVVPRYNQRRGNRMVAASLVLLGACLLPVGPAWSPASWLRLVGVVLATAGLVLAAVAVVRLGRAGRIHPVPAQGSTVCTGGVYAWLRHPTYAGVMLLSAGVALAGGQLLAIPGMLGLGLMLAATARFEEDLLVDVHGWEYAAYACRVPAALPRGRHA